MKEWLRRTVRMVWGVVFLPVAAAIFLFWAVTRKLQEEANTLEVTRYSIDDHPLGRRLRAVHLSDIHFDPASSTMTPDLLDRVVETVNSLSPDLIFLTGDYINRDPSPIDELAERWLSRLSAKIGTYASLGNHDSYYTEGKERITKALEAAGITVLRNESVNILDGAITIIGLEDLWGRAWEGSGAAMQEGSAKGGYTIVLSHNPDTAVSLAKFTFDLHLAGHTHGGQICFPNGTPVLSVMRILADLVPFNLVQKLARKLKKGRNYMYVTDDWSRAYGRVRVRGDGTAPMRTLIVSRGLGSHMGWRMYCRPEVGVLDFE